jgi:hypothetical protein
LPGWHGWLEHPPAVASQLELSATVLSASKGLNVVSTSSVFCVGSPGCGGNVPSFFATICSELLRAPGSAGCSDPLLKVTSVSETLELAA